MKHFLFTLIAALALITTAAACGGDDDDDDADTGDDTTDSPGVVTAEEDGGEEDGTEATPPEDVEIEGNEVQDGSDDLVDLLSLVPAADVGTEVPADIAAAVDIQSASLVVEGSEIVLTMTLAGEIGAPADFTRGYDFAFNSEAFVAAERGAYQETTLIIGAERSGGAWTVIKKAGANDPLPLDGATVTVEGSTVVIRVPFNEIISTGSYVWRAIAFSVVTPEFAVADVAPDGPGFVSTPLPEAPESTGTPPPAQSVTPVPTP